MKKVLPVIRRANIQIYIPPKRYYGQLIPKFQKDENQTDEVSSPSDKNKDE